MDVDVRVEGMGIALYMEMRKAGGVQWQARVVCDDVGLTFS